MHDAHGGQNERNDGARNRKSFILERLAREEDSKLPRFSKEGTGSTGVELDSTTLDPTATAGATKIARARIAVAAGGL
jgi:hypothetical protein